MKPLRIADAKAIAKRIGADQVVVLAFKSNGELVAGASYGQTKAQCTAVGKWMDWLIDDMYDGLRTPASYIEKNAQPNK